MWENLSNHHHLRHIASTFSQRECSRAFAALVTSDNPESGIKMSEHMVGVGEKKRCDDRQSCRCHTAVRSKPSTLACKCRQSATYSAVPGSWRCAVALGDKIPSDNFKIRGGALT